MTTSSLPFSGLPVLGFGAACLLSAVAACTAQTEPAAEQVGTVDSASDAFDLLIDPGARVEILADGYEWTEGPVWIKEEGFLVFSDTDTNTIHRWAEGDGASPWLSPSGYTGDAPRGGGMGSNGLAVDGDGNLLLCQHGDRRLARMVAPVSSPEPQFETLADSFGGARFSSPNDLVIAADGSVWFTDPPYGLATPDGQEQPFNGVYRVQPNGTVTLIDSTLSRPNGIAFSPDEQTLYVANSDPGRAIWKAYDVAPDGTVSQGRTFHDATNSVGRDNPGLPDGLKVDVQGNVFATGPGGVWVFNPEGDHLGTVRTRVPTANVAFGGEDGGTLFLTSDMYLARVQTRTTGLGF